MKFVLACALLCGITRAQVAVPFKGCKSGGQTGPVEASKGKSISKVVSQQVANQLAIYNFEGGAVGVLAPRGWYRFGTYGSAGTALFVSPEPINAANLFSTGRGGFTGPVIEVSENFGETSGRFEVADIIARVFPAWKSFVTKVMNEGDPIPSSFAFGPYPGDTMTYKGKTVAEYTTRTGTDGLGTQ